MDTQAVHIYVTLIGINKWKGIWAKVGASYNIFMDAKISLTGIVVKPTNGIAQKATNFGFAFVNGRIYVCKGKEY